MDYQLQIDPRTGESHLRVSLRGTGLLKHSLLNKGSAFTDSERGAFGLRGLLPATVSSIREQLDRVRTQYDFKLDDLQKSIYLSGLQNRNETLFYRFLIENLEEIVPIVYTPTVAEACQHWSRIHRHDRGIYVTLEDRGRIPEVLRSRKVQDPAVIVVTDNERILGIGDQGAGGMGIPIGKLALYTAGAGIHPASCVPISLDVGTNNERLLKDPLYFGVRQPRLRGDEYWSLVGEFVAAVKEVFPGGLLQWEDFGNITSFRNLDSYRDEVTSFNDDIQGTAAMVVGGLLAAMRGLGSQLTQQRVVMAGAGSGGVGIARTLVAAMVSEGIAEAEARSRLWLTDSKGLLTTARQDLAVHKLEFAVDAERLQGWGTTAPTLADVVRNVRPDILIGVSGQQGLFTKELIREQADNVERPIILALSNPTTHTEVVPADALDWSDGRAIVATGSPFSPVERHGRTHRIGQGNNMFVFPGVGLGTIAVGASRVSDDMFLAAATALADCVADELVETGCLFPDIADVGAVSQKVAMAVAQQAIDEGLAEPIEDLSSALEAKTWTPEYLPYEPA